jgi:hypothetical protein
LLQWALFDFGQGIPRVLVVLNPTARKQAALDMRATVDREEFFQFQHGDGRLKLIERLASAYRAGELPDYMLEFVDSLRTRTTRTTFRATNLLRPNCSSCPQDLVGKWVGAYAGSGSSVTRWPSCSSWRVSRRTVWSGRSRRWKWSKPRSR